MIGQVIEIEGKRFVLVEESKLRQLELAAGGRQRARQRSRALSTSRRNDGTTSMSKRSVNEMPPLPEADAEGNRPALEFIRATIARDIIRERKALGLTQEQLARLAGVRQETLSRIESARNSPNVRTVAKIERALKRAKTRAGR